MEGLLERKASFAVLVTHLPKYSGEEGTGF
jgi:hypothetical protein